MFFKEIGFKASMMEFAMSLAVEKNKRWYGFGTATVIGPNLALTAKHVVNNAFRSFDRRLILPEDNFLLRGTDQANADYQIAGTFRLYACNFIRKNNKIAIWNITKIWTCGNTDVAILRLSPLFNCVEYDWKKFPIQLKTPSVGQFVHAYGYHSSKLEFDDSGDVPSLTWKDSPTMTAGQVLGTFDTLEQARENGKTFPCFTANFKTQDGMSGGPVVTANGELCGVISSTWKNEEASEQHTTTVASLWPVMCTTMEANGLLTIGERDVFSRLLDLARLGLIDVKEWQRINCDVINRKASISWTEQIIADLKETDK